MSGEPYERDQLEVEGHGLVLLVLLGSTATSRTWLAADAAGALHVVRRLTGRGETERASLLSRLSRLAQLRHPGLLSPELAWVEGTDVWVVRPHGPGVSLRRLTAVARLDPRHVAAIGGDVLDGLAAVHAVGAAHGALHPGNILVGVDGRARVVDVGLAASVADSAGSDGGDEPGPGRGAGHDIEAVAAALRIAMVPGRRPGVTGPGPHRRAERLVGLDAILGGPALAFAGASSASAARIALYHAVGEPGARTRSEITALVSPLHAVRPVATPALVSVPPPQRERPHPARRATQAPATLLGRRAAAPTARPWHLPSGWRISSGWRLMAWLVPLAAVVLVAGVAVMLSGRHTGAVATPVPSPAAPVRSEPTAASTPTSGAASPATSPPAATPPAPPAAGPIVGLSVNPQGGGGCTVTAGGSCEIQVNVNLEPQQGETTITFDLLLVDECTDASSTLSGGSMMAASGFDLVWTDAPVVFPSGDPMMLYAVTSSPAQAASPGLALMGATSAC